MRKDYLKPSGLRGWRKDHYVVWIVIQHANRSLLFFTEKNIQHRGNGTLSHDCAVYSVKRWDMLYLIPWQIMGLIDSVLLMKIYSKIIWYFCMGLLGLRNIGLKNIGSS